MEMGMNMHLWSYFYLPEVNRIMLFKKFPNIKMNEIAFERASVRATQMNSTVAVCNAFSIEDWNKKHWLKRKMHLQIWKCIWMKIPFTAEHLAIF